jgi:hypothetical protein
VENGFEKLQGNKQTNECNERHWKTGTEGRQQGNKTQKQARKFVAVVVVVEPGSFS